MQQITLTEQQRKVYDSLVSYLKEYGFPPTVRELCSILEYASTSSIAAHLHKLEEVGLIIRKAGCPRAIQVIGGKELENG